MLPLQEEQDTAKQLAHKLLATFGELRRLHWRYSPIPGLTPGEMMLMVSIKRGQEADETGLNVSEIGNLLHVSSPTVTQQVNSLVARGYVEKTVDRADRRVVRITLTARGDVVVQKAFEHIVCSYEGLVTYLGEEDTNKLIELFAKMFTYFSDLQASHSAGEE